MYEDTQKSITKQHLSLKHTKLILPFLPESWRKIRNATIQANISFSYTLGDNTWQWRIAPHGEGFVQPQLWVCLLYMRIGGHLCQCYFDSLAPLALAPVQEDDLANLPQELLEVLFQASTDSVLQSLSQTLGYSCELVDFTLYTKQSTQQSPSYTPSGEGLAFTLTSQQNHSVTRGYLLAELPHPLFDFIYKRAKSKNKQRNLFSFDAEDNMYLSVPIIKTLSSLTIQDINTLEIGDCLLFPAQESPFAVHAHIDDTCVLQAVWDREKQKITLEKNMQEDSLVDEAPFDESSTEENTPSPPLLDAQQCTVPVQCQLGSVSLNLATLGSLCPGMVLGPLDSIDAPVTVRVGSSTVARGALVDIEGRLGVQLTEVFLQNKS